VVRSQEEIRNHFPSLRVYEENALLFATQENSVVIVFGRLRHRPLIKRWDHKCFRSISLLV
jgi:hypothetical protein